MALWWKLLWSTSTTGQHSLFFFLEDSVFPDHLLLIWIKSLMLLSVMQATSHVNRICLSQSAASVHSFHAYSKGSRVSLQSAQTSWTFPRLRLLFYYPSLSTTCAQLQPSALWQNCLFRPCWVERPVLKGILFWSWSHMLLSFTDEFV